MPTPIFVLGKHRSGTTWLANLLCQHSQIAGITHEKHFGIHESAYFSCVYGRYGNLDEKSNFVEFVEVISASDYFRLAGANKKYLYSLWPTTYEDLFKKVMDRFAAERGAKLWIEKTPPHSVLVNQLSVIYPDAKFITVIRDVEAVVASTIALAGTEPESKMSNVGEIFSTVVSWVIYNKILRSFGKHSDKMLTIRYEDLKSDLEHCLQKICAFLEIPFEPEMSELPFVRNTSFTKIKRGQALSGEEKMMIRFTRHIFELIPLWILNAINKRIKSKKKRNLPPWFFKMHEFSEMTRQIHESNDPG